VNNEKLLKMGAYLKENAPWLSKLIDGRLFCVIDTNHAIERSIERGATESELTTIGNRIIKWISDNIQKYKNDEETNFLFYSKSLERGVVAKLAYNRATKLKQIILITVLPKNRSNAAPDTRKIVFESFLSPEVIWYIESLVENPKFEYDGSTYLIEEHGLEVVTVDTVPYDIVDHDIIELD
jgi:hypothetical protein